MINHGLHGLRGWGRMSREKTQRAHKIAPSAGFQIVHAPSAQSAGTRIFHAVRGQLRGLRIVPSLLTQFVGNRIVVTVSRQFIVRNDFE